MNPDFWPAVSLLPRDARGVRANDIERMRALALSYLDSWNSNNVERILAHYADHLVFGSPAVVSHVDQEPRTLVGRSQMQRHVERRLAGYLRPSRFKFIDVMVGVGGYAVYYVDPDGQFTVDCICLNAEDKATSISQFIAPCDEDIDSCQKVTP
jgi:ketosteroid isomerase-like protein